MTFPSIPKVDLPNSESCINSIPSLGLGTYQIPKDKTTSVVLNALKLGYTHIDTASDYGNEQEVCNAISQFLSNDPNHTRRSDLFYTTKIWDDDQGYDKTKLAVEKALLKASEIEYIDLILIHTPRTSSKLRHGSWSALQEFVDLGKVKNIGVSNYGVDHLLELLKYSDLKYKPVINQIELRPWLTRSDLVQFCRDNGIVIEAYSPLAQGKKLNDGSVLMLSEKYEVTPAQLLVGWSLNKGNVCLCKTVSDKRLLSNLKSVDVKLADDDVQSLDLLDCYDCGWDPTVFPIDGE